MQAYAARLVSKNYTEICFFLKKQVFVKPQQN